MRLPLARPGLLVLRTPVGFPRVLELHTGRLLATPEQLLRCWRWLAGAVLIVALAQPARAQSEPSGAREHHAAAWFGLMTDWQLSGPWSIWFDTHYNTRSFLVLRGGLTHHFEIGPSVTLGYAHLWTRPGYFDRDEHRPWGQVFMPFAFSERWSLSQRLRLELRIRQRVLDDEVVAGWVNVLRWRSQTAVSHWLVRQPDGGGWFVQTALEMLANGGSNAGPNFLDQNRVSVMGGFRTGPFTVRLGYLDRFVPGSSGATPVHEHNAVLWVNYKFKQSDPAPPKRPEAPEIGNP